MAQRLTCPGCQVILTIQDDSPTTTWSCPRCQTPLSVLTTSPGVNEAGTNVVAAQPANREAVLRDRPTAQRVGLDQEANRDIFAVSIVIVILIGCCVLGIVAVLTVLSYDSFPMMILFGILDVLVLLQLAIWLGRKLHVLKEAKGTFLAGCGTVFLFFLLAVATLTFLFFACGVLWLQRANFK